MEEYVVDSTERISSAARNIEEVTETAKDFKKRMKNERKNSWKEKELHGQYLRQTEEVAGPERWLWLRDGNLKRETESLIISYEVPLPPNMLHSEFQCLGRILAFFSFLVRYFAFSIEISRLFKMYDFRFVLSSDFQSFLTHLRLFIFLLVTSD